MASMYTPGEKDSTLDKYFSSRPQSQTERSSFAQPERCHLRGEIRVERTEESVVESPLDGEELADVSHLSVVQTRSSAV